MNKRIVQIIISASFLTLVVLLNGCSPAAQSELEATAPSPEIAEPATEAAQLATARVTAEISEAGRAVVTGHNNTQYIVDADTESTGLHEIDTLLAAQITCGVFVAEKAAQELDIPLTGVTGTAVFDENTQQVQVFLDLPGADGEQILDLANNFRQRCPIYTTLSAAKSVEFIPGEQYKLRR